MIGPVFPPTHTLTRTRNQGGQEMGKKCVNTEASYPYPADE